LPIPENNEASFEVLYSKNTKKEASCTILKVFIFRQGGDGMKKRIAAFAACLLMVLACSVCGADDLQLKVDETFARTNTWLSQQNLALTGSPSARNDITAFEQGTLLFYGEAVGNPAHESPAQREIMAKRAAVVVAQRALAEYLQGFALVGDTLVRDCVARHDTIRTSVSAFIGGAQIVSQEYSRDRDMAIAVIKMGLHGPRGFASSLYEKMDNDPQLAKDLMSKEPVFERSPIPMKDKYDGLIIDATEQNFRPAIINRLYTAGGEVVYDPARNGKKRLVERGCGDYAKSLEKARESLAGRGVANPLIVKAAGARNSSDLQVSEEDAVSVYSSNLKTGFLKEAKVAFVVR
jgi:hypothetical protein